MRSIRRHLIVPLLVGSGLLILAVGLGASAVVARRLRGEFDDSLLTKARALVTLTEQRRGEVEINFADEFMPEFTALDRPEYFQLRLADGTVIERSGSLGSRDLPHSRELSRLPRYRDLRLPDGRPGRVVEVAFVPQSEDDEDVESETAFDPAAPPGQLRSAVLSVARGRERLDELIRSFYIGAIATAALLLAGIASLVHLSVRRGLAPLDEIRSQVQALDAERLDSRIVIHPPVRELLPVVEQLNALILRLKDTFERERRFSSDVAHELRTPVAELRSLADVGARWPDDRESIQAFFEDARSIAQQMERTVATLLSLTRCEAGIEETERRVIHLPDLLADTWSGLAAEAESRSLWFSLTSPTTAIVSDPDKLRVVVVNLFANAVAYSPPGSTIFCSARAVDGTLEITVSNPAPQLAPADIPYLFERFWRKDAARSNGRHAGLGLPLARSFATLLGFELTAHLSPDQRLALRLMGPIENSS